MNYLICSAGRRCQLLDDLRHSMEEGSCIVATDSSPYAPALYFADRQYIVEPIYSPEYIETILKICKEEK